MSLGSIRSRLRGWWGRLSAMVIKEFIQMRRDRVGLATMIMIPLVQLILFGYAINTTPRHLPTAVLMQETSDAARSIIAALENTRYFKVTHRVGTVEEFDRLLASGEVIYAIEIPAGFERALRRGDRPSLLLAVDATDPVATGAALSSLSQIVTTALRHDLGVPDSGQSAFEIRPHERYNPARVTQLNIVPGLLGTILTLTMLVSTSQSVTREIERGTLESLLSMPVSPLEIMAGKIIPYILLGFLQALLIFGAGVGLFGVPVLGNTAALAVLTTLFIATNLSIGYTFSTLAQNQLQGVQMSMMFFLPNVLISGFAFPFDGMPRWAQWIGECLPATHFIRIARGIMLKGSTIVDLRVEIVWLAALMALAMTVAVTRFRRTLD